jgi:hypothetical protein
MVPSITSIVRLAARATAILIAVGFVVFALGEPVGSFRVLHFREWVGIVLLFGAVAASLLAWTWEFPAAVISLLALGAFAAVAQVRRYDVLAIAAIPNILFLLDWKLRRSHPSQASKAT